MVSHELRTPLGLVVGLSDLILREATDGPELAPQLRQDLERMAASAAHLGRLIDDVLDLASGQAGQLRLSIEPVDLMLNQGMDPSAAGAALYNFVTAPETATATPEERAQRQALIASLPRNSRMLDRSTARPSPMRE